MTRTERRTRRREIRRWLRQRNRTDSSRRMAEWFCRRYPNFEVSASFRMGHEREYGVRFTRS